MAKKTVKQRRVSPCTHEDWVYKAHDWAINVSPNLFSEDKEECKFTREDLHSSFMAGIKALLSSVWHDVRKELPEDGAWCLLETTCGFRLATYRPMQTGSYRWWLMDYSMYDGKGLIRWAYVADLCKI